MEIKSKGEGGQAVGEGKELEGGRFAVIFPLDLRPLAWTWLFYFLNIFNLTQDYVLLF